MAKAKVQNPAGAGLVFAAHNNHTPQCGLPPRVRNTDNLGLYYGHFENRFGEQFVFVFDRATKTGTITGGDLDWGNPRRSLSGCWKRPSAPLECLPSGSCVKAVPSHHACRSSTPRWRWAASPV
ncbi:MAG: hypothetical protein ACLQU5_09065 [Isosphaeraceae bacterium]